jgi:ribosomal protein L28
MGNGTAKPRASTILWTARKASAPHARGIAYSISVNRTRRGVVKIRSERSTRELFPPNLVTVRLMAGIHEGTRRPSLHATPKA